MVQMLISLGAFVEAANEEQLTPLQLAASAGGISPQKLLCFAYERLYHCI